MAVFVLPTGEKVRTQSKSPLVLFIDQGQGAFIEKRSASRETILAAARKRSGRKFIADQRTGAVEEV